MANLISLASLDCLVWSARLASFASIPSLPSLASPVRLTDKAGLCQDLASNHVGMADLASPAVVASLASLANLANPACLNNLTGLSIGIVYRIV